MALVQGSITVADDGTVTGAGVGVAGALWTALAASPYVVIPDHNSPPSGMSGSDILPLEVATKRFYAGLVNAIAEGTFKLGSPRASWRFSTSAPGTYYDAQGESGSFSLDDSGATFATYVNDNGSIPVVAATAYALDGTTPAKQITSVVATPGNVRVNFEVGVTTVLLMIW